ncbi:MAG: UDP-N-acetylmuramate dehydrogenase [Deltaproteobacteria bacterium]|nr:UDP-N-acetylmuramate dehydrogenase [Deltaproteobacteria bacterium]
MKTPVGGEQGAIVPWASVFREEMDDFLTGDVSWNTSLAGYTTFKVGGKADLLVFPRRIHELSLLIQGLRKIEVPWTMLGRGSNVVIGDQGVAGAVIILDRDFAAIEQIGESDNSALVRVEAGCGLARLVNWTIRKGLGGLEFAAGIPGSIGGAIVMNAGAWQQEMKDVLAAVSIMDEKGTLRARRVEEMHFSYRSWGEKPGQIVLEGFFRLPKDDPASIKKRCGELRERRKRSQPRHVANAGSFFKNPPGPKTAGQLIDEAGLKGRSIGGAMVSPVHANFIVNTGTATARDILELMRVVQETVQRKSGIKLEPEVKILGLP